MYCMTSTDHSTAQVSRCAQQTHHRLHSALSLSTDKSFARTLSAVLLRRPWTIDKSLHQIAGRPLTSFPLLSTPFAMLSTLARSKSNVQLELDAAAAALKVAQAEQQVVRLQLMMQQLQDEQDTAASLSMFPLPLPPLYPPSTPSFVSSSSSLSSAPPLAHVALRIARTSSHSSHPSHLREHYPITSRAHSLTLLSHVVDSTTSLPP